MVEKVQPTGVLPGEGLTVGVLALQGGVSEHAEMLESLGAQVRWVRTGEQLEGLMRWFCRVVSRRRLTV